MFEANRASADSGPRLPTTHVTSLTFDFSRSSYTRTGQAPVPRLSSRRDRGSVQATRTATGSVCRDGNVHGSPRWRAGRCSEREPLAEWGMQNSPTTIVPRSRHFGSACHCPSRRCRHRSAVSLLNPRTAAEARTVSRPSTHQRKRFHRSGRLRYQRAVWVKVLNVRPQPLHRYRCRPEKRPHFCTWRPPQCGHAEPS